MTRRTVPLNDDLYDYLLAISLRESGLARRLRKETNTLPEAEMQIAPEQGQFMALLLQMMGAREVLEIGTFTGYSSLVMAEALDGGHLTTCDNNPECTAVARRYWDEAGVGHKIDLRLGPAVHTLETLIDEGRAGTFDFVFIDADKEFENLYYERSLLLVRKGGIIAIDNVFWSGRVTDPRIDDADTAAIRRLNKKIHQDERVFMTTVPIADGLTLAQKR